MKLDWPLLLDSMENQLANYAARPSPEPRSVMAGLKRNFSVSLPESIRASHHVFDVQCSGNSTDRTLVLLPKDSPPAARLIRHLPGMTSTSSTPYCTGPKSTDALHRHSWEAN